ncbi:hypothetical protein [Bacillus cereus]|uniref:hypothetical protein n=1 Tax=Bacillus cereus TaxID=1396 RepID=UPI001F1CB819|nr:hypothetical protein [Bacillus cereus]BCC44628.1 hypothetical protein BCJMU01_p205 [Bacillus cereus]
MAKTKKKKSDKPTKKEKKRQKRKAMVKLTPKQIKDNGLEGVSKRRMREVESFREHVIKVHTVAKESNITVRESKNNADSTRNQYLQKSLQTLTAIHARTGKNFFEITKEDVSSYLKEKYPNNYSISPHIAAMGYLQTVIDESGDMFRTKPQFMERIKLKNGKEVWDIKYTKTEEEEERDFIRRAGKSTVQMATEEQIDILTDTISASRIYEPHRKQIVEIIRLSKGTGARISGAVELTYGDIMTIDGKMFMRHENDIEDEKEVDVHLQEKAGHHRDTEFIEVRDKEAIDLLTELKNRFPPGTSPDRRIFEFREQVKRDKKTGEYLSGGQKLSDDTVKTKIQNAVTKAAKKSNINDVENGKRISMHSARKCFAQSRVDYYSAMTVKELREEVDRRIEKNEQAREKEKERVRQLKSEGKTKAEINQRLYPNFAKKFDILKERINWVKKPTKEKPEGERRTKVDREPNHKELVLFLSSLDIGHQRVDVIRFYAVYIYKEGKISGVKYYEKKD